MKKNQNNILIIDDEPEIRGLMQEILNEEGYLTFSVKNAKEAQKIIADNPPDLVYLDIWMPEKDGITLLKEWSEANQLNFPVIMISGHATIETAVEATRLGAFDFIEKPLSIEKLVASAKKALSASVKSSGKDIALILKNNCSVYTDIFLTLDSEVDSDQVLFLNGEAGTEKEEFAKYIHHQKYNEENRFAALQLNLLAFDQLENTLVTNELKKIIDTVEKGTIFLSGYSELALKYQSQAHNFLQKLPVGQDLKFIVGVNFNKKEKLYEQNKELSSIISNGIMLDLPPLRQCLQDIPELLKGFIDYFGTTEELMPRRFSLAAQNILTKYAWPGNLKQLKNMVHATLLRPGKEIVNIEEIEETLTLQGPSGDLLVQKDILSMTMVEAKEQFEKAFLTRQLELVGGKVTELARRVGMERTNLYRKLSSLNIDYKNK
jgi:DNA-binding NtrC family response regulator